jgi:hypothetical protein
MKLPFRRPGLLREQHFRRLRNLPTIGERIEGWLAKAGHLLRADGLYYNDMRAPFIGADVTAVTLASTAKALYPASNFPVLGGQYFAVIGKALRIRLFGRMTTGATPGNGSFNVYYGTGADANGTLLMTGTPVALVANGTTLPWMCEIDVHCRSTGSAGTLFCTGWSLFHVGLLLSTAAPMLLPATAPAVSGAVDLTAANIISVQFLRSGSTAETMQVHNMQVIALN